jgi:hypothetical protein
MELYPPPRCVTITSNGIGYGSGNIGGDPACSGAYATAKFRVWSRRAGSLPKLWGLEEWTGRWRACRANRTAGSRLNTGADEHLMASVVAWLFASERSVRAG